MTTKNSAKTIDDCLTSIFSNSDPATEVIVVDSMSDDGTADILRGYGRRIRLISTECQRGRGRQIAFEHSTGQYIIVMDADMVLLPTVHDFLSLYHEKFEGLAFLVLPPGSFREHGTPLFIAPASVLREVGGWRDIQISEDYELWSRLAYAGKFRFTYVNTNPFVCHLREPAKWFQAVRGAYNQHRECYAYGCRIPWRNYRVLPIALIAYVSYLCTLNTIQRFDNPAARRVTGVSRAEPFLLRLHHFYSCYVPSSILDSIANNPNDSKLSETKTESLTSS